ncbi:hypothetical protein SLS60_009627 [Paraconiothyrium brasiliense]|uniref:Uncharacterized protein n=1 Tax=Paraconiothyrium brasiliense TaxID=300254 RepID=A0ABR3QUV8_9PLEO
MASLAPANTPPRNVFTGNDTARCPQRGRPGRAAAFVLGAGDAVAEVGLQSISLASNDGEECGDEGEMSPRFLNPRTAPLPPAVKDGRRGMGGRRHSGVSCVLEEEPGRMVLWEIVARVQERVREEMEMERERDNVGADKELDFGYNTVKKRRQRRNLVKTKAFHVLKHVTVEV